MQIRAKALELSGQKHGIDTVELLRSESTPAISATD